MSDSIETMLVNAENAAAAVAKPPAVVPPNSVAVAPNRGFAAPQLASMESFLQQGLTPEAYIKFSDTGTLQVDKKGTYPELIVGVSFEEIRDQFIYSTSYGQPIQYFTSKDRQMSDTGLPWNQVVAEGFRISQMLGKKYRGDFQTCKLYMHVLNTTKDALGKSEVAAGLTVGYTPTVTGVGCINTLITGIKQYGELIRVKITCASKSNSEGNWGIPKFEVLGPWDGKIGV